MLLATIAFLAALLLAALTTPLFGRIGERLRLVALPGGRRRHPGPVSVLGGVGLFVGFGVTALGLYFFAPLRPEHRLPLTGVLLGSGFVFLAGLADDRFEFPAWPQFLVQIGAAAIAIATTVWIQEVTLPVIGFKHFPWFITWPLTIAWVMGMMNTVNFLDGLDGLAAGVGAIAAILFAVHSYSLGQNEIALYPLALAGACLGFLIFNFNPARVFLGSAGAMVLGYALATLSILAPARVMTALLIMVIPLADTAFQIFDRWRRRKSPFVGDRGHLHYRLMDLGFSQRRIVVTYWLLCALFGVFVLLATSRILKLVALVVVGLSVFAVMLWLSRKQERGQ